MQKTIRNNTPNELVITGADGRQIALAPLELREFKEEDVTGFDFSEASHAGTITVRTVPPSELAAEDIRESVWAWVYGRHWVRFSFKLSNTQMVS